MDASGLSMLFELSSKKVVRIESCEGETSQTTNQWRRFRKWGTSPAFLLPASILHDFNHL